MDTYGEFIFYGWGLVAVSTILFGAIDFSFDLPYSTKVRGRVCVGLLWAWLLLLIVSIIYIASFKDKPDIYVIDGDTFSVGDVRYRLRDVDAPEIYSPRCEAEAVKGQQAAAMLRKWVKAAEHVDWNTYNVDRYGRVLVDLRIDGEDVGDKLISLGLAVRWVPGKLGWEQRMKHWCGE